jgi:hypothetical protein
MIRDTKLLKEFEKELIRKEKPNFYKNLRLVDELHKEAINLHVFKKNLHEELEGIEVKLKVARVVNNVRNTT